MNNCIAGPQLVSNDSSIGVMPTARRVRLFGFDVDPLRMPEAVSRLLDWIDDDDRRCRYVVTPNVDHAILFQEHAGLRQAYADAELVLVDGMPVLIAAKLLQRGIPERVAGSDLVPALFDACTATRQLRVYLLGAAPGVAKRAAVNIENRWPRVQVVGCDSPAIGFERCPAESDGILSRIAAAEADVLIVGLGAPKQELWVQAHHHGIAAPVALCVGATIDFLAGERKRAPVWMRRIGLEWLHRTLTEPRRLAKRYLRGAVRFPGLLWREWSTGGM